MLNNEMEFEPGIWIDASNQSADTLNVRIIELANEFGLVLIPGVVSRYKLGMMSPNDSEALNEIADECVVKLNDEFAEHNFVWTVEDNSLFLARIED